MDTVFLLDQHTLLEILPFQVDLHLNDITSIEWMYSHRNNYSPPCDVAV